jgi:Family of unknown function (DUF6788)
MPWAKDLCHPETVRVAVSHQAEAQKIAAELAAIASSGMVLPGSITERRTRCGRASCSCHADPPRLHGPYWQWTRKVAARTVCRWLSAEQNRDYTAWIDNDRRLRELLARLEALGTAAFEADPRWHRQAAKTNVGPRRLTCGQPSSQALFAQLSPKREDVSTSSQLKGILRSCKMIFDLLHATGTANLGPGLPAHVEGAASVSCPDCGRS